MIKTLTLTDFSQSSRLAWRIAEGPESLFEYGIPIPHDFKQKRQIDQRFSFWIVAPDRLH